MALTKKQLSERQGYVGASEVAKIVLGDGAYDLWLAKTGKLVDNNESSPAMEMGLMLEHSILRRAQKDLGPIEKRGSLLEYKHSELPIVSHPDGIVKLSGEPVEVKTSGLFGPAMAGFGNPGTDELPERYLIQATVHLMCAMRNLCHVPVVLGGKGYQMYVVQRNADLVAAIAEKVALFWQKVQADIPPDGWPSIDVARMIRRTEGKRLMIDVGPVQRWREAESIAKEAKDKAEQAKAAVLATLGDAEIGESPLGIVTVIKGIRKAYTVAEAVTTTVRFKEAK